MSKDIEQGPGGPEDGDRIVLVATGDQYWLFEGDEHINSMLAGYDRHPRPVICLVFETMFDLQVYLPEGVTVQRLWAINPAIIDRMRREGELVERPAPGQ